MRKRWLLLIITAFFGLALLAVDRYTSELTPAGADQADNEPDYYGEKLISRQYSDEGIQSQKFTADSSSHYPGIGNTYFSQPEFTVLDEEGSQWLISAVEGPMTDADKTLQLINDVKIRPLDTAANHNLLIRTERLTYHHSTGIAETDQLVTITSDRANMTAVGMRMDVPAQHIRFNAEVNSRYEP